MNEARIMLVEDDQGHRLLIRESLRLAGFTHHLIEMEDGQQALDYLFGRGAYSAGSLPRPGLIILDIKMPKKDGFAVLKAVKEDSQLRLIPVLVLTSTDDQDEVDRCYDFGACSYMVKPVRPEAFQEQVRSLGLFLEIVRLPR
jgi:CheY-like chemotaxis protein